LNSKALFGQETSVERRIRKKRVSELLYKDATEDNGFNGYGLYYRACKIAKITPCVIPGEEIEVPWHPNRQFRADYAYMHYNFLIEYMGQGAHQRIAGYEYDIRRMAQAMAQGYKILWFTALTPAKELANDMLAIMGLPTIENFETKYNDILENPEIGRRFKSNSYQETSRVKRELKKKGFNLSRAKISSNPATYYCIIVADGHDVKSTKKAK